MYSIQFNDSIRPSLVLSVDTNAWPLWNKISTNALCNHGILVHAGNGQPIYMLSLSVATLISIFCSKQSTLSLVGQQVPGKCVNWPSRNNRCCQTHCRWWDQELQSKGRSVWISRFEEEVSWLWWRNHLPRPLLAKLSITQTCTHSTILHTHLCKHTHTHNYYLAKKVMVEMTVC